MSIGGRNITILRGPDDVASWKRDVALLFLKYMKPQSDLGHPMFTQYTEQHVWSLMYRSVQPVAERLKQDGWDATCPFAFGLWQAVASNDWLAPAANMRIDTTNPGAARLIKQFYTLTPDDDSSRAMRNLLHTMNRIKWALADLGVQLRDDFAMGSLLPKLHSHMTEKKKRNMLVLASNSLLPWGPTGLYKFLRDIRYDTPAPGSNTDSGTGPNTGSGCLGSDAVRPWFLELCDSHLLLLYFPHPQPHPLPYLTLYLILYLILYLNLHLNPHLNLHLSLHLNSRPISTSYTASYSSFLTSGLDLLSRLGYIALPHLCQKAHFKLPNIAGPALPFNARICTSPLWYTLRAKYQSWTPHLPGGLYRRYLPSSERRTSTIGSPPWRNISKPMT
ncbi:hypothetical protein GE09DRAFT_1058966 [Coniochaeta sp. 2T2.1]|nr:hypothetical protein GE09DRAFT_1058966 [Coniochaeta sp. 2T2.1]